MRLVALFAILAAVRLSGQSHDEAEVIATVERTFKGMAAHDEAMIRSTMLPDAHLYSVRNEGAPVVVASADWVKRITATQGDIVERFTSRPAVSVRGRMAQLWGKYEFVRGGKLSHCGVDAVTLFKTAGGWKIAVIAFTMETEGCGGR